MMAQCNTFKLPDENNFPTQNENFFNDDENMDMFFLKTLLENIFLPKKGKLQGNESDGIADLGWAQQADCSSSGRENQGTVFSCLNTVVQEGKQNHESV